MEKVFTEIYEKECWGNNKQENYRGSSGMGSGMDYNANTYVPFLRDFIIKNNIKTVADAGSGDFRCGPSIYDGLEVDYIGYDAYKPLVDHLNNTTNYKFKHMDIFGNRSEIESADLLILKDVIQHWKTIEINIFLDYIVDSKKFKYILITNCSRGVKENQDISTGNWRALSCLCNPLRKYKPTLLYQYDTKEVSCIYI